MEAGRVQEARRSAAAVAGLSTAVERPEREAGPPAADAGRAERLAAAGRRAPVAGPLLEVAVGACRRLAAEA